MGLLDYLFDPTTYGGQGGLLAGLQQNVTQIPPSQGFSPTFADRFQPATDNPLGQPPAQQTFANRFQPAADNPMPAIVPSMPIGNYQMPRLGNMADYTPQQSGPAALPPNAQPAQGQLPMAPQAAPQAPPQLPPALGGGMSENPILRGIQSMARGGGLISAITGNYNDPQSVQQQNLKAQYDATRQALIANGMPASQANSTAMLAVMNPEAAKTILPEALSNKEKYQVVSEDPLTGKRYGFVNDRAQTVNGQPVGATAQPSASPLADLETAKSSGVSGEALYGYLPSSMRNTVKAMIEGRQPLPSTAAMRSPATLALIDAAHAVDPTFDATSWSARQAGAKDFTSGKSAEMVRAANQTLAHVGSLLDAMDKLNNGRVPALNAVGNTFNEQVLGKGEPGSFRTNAHAVAEEMSKVFKGANLSDAEIRQWEQNLTENMSPDQQRAQIAKLSELLHGSLAALEEKRTAAIGPMASEKAGPIIKEEGRKVLERIDTWLKGGQSNAKPATSQYQEGQTATNPQTGQTLTFRNGKWQ